MDPMDDSAANGQCGWQHYGLCHSVTDVHTAPPPLLLPGPHTHTGCSVQRVPTFNSVVQRVPG
eukprot:881201-Rhodomonas_salina.2